MSSNDSIWGDIIGCMTVMILIGVLVFVLFSIAALLSASHKHEECCQYPCKEVLHEQAE